MSMKVFRRRNGAPCHVGYADIPQSMPHKLRLLRMERDRCIYVTYTVEEVRVASEDGGRPLQEHAVLLAEDQPPDLLPGWRPIEK